MAEYKDCYIAYFDILGFKEIVKNMPCDKIVSMFEAAKHNQYFSIVSGGEHECQERDLLRPEDIHLKIMSDSIIIFTEAKYYNSLPGLIITCAYYQAYMLALPEPVLLRGGIAKGNLYYDGNIIFGPGFIDAYLLENNNAIVPRVIFPQILFSQFNNGDEAIKHFASKMLKLEADQFYSLDYFYVLCQLTIHDHPLIIDDLYAYIQRTLATTTNQSIREKFLYLKERIQPYYDHREEIYA